jgi:hypothetical protein
VLLPYSRRTIVMKYYVVSEDELAFLVSLDGYLLSDLERTEASVRARPVPEWATEFTGDPYNQGYVESWESEEIKR